jgi:hypothetical protein
MPKSKVIADLQELFRFLATPSIEVTNLLFAVDEVLWAKWNYMGEQGNMPVLRHTNEEIGVYVRPGSVSNCSPMCARCKRGPSTAIPIP